MPNLEQSVLIYLNTEEVYLGFEGSNVAIYLHGEEFQTIEREQLCYIHADEEVVIEPDPENSVRPSLGLYMEGGEFDNGQPVTAFVYAFLEGSGLSSKQSLYLQAPLGSVGSRDAFIEGYSASDLSPKGAIRFEAAKQQYATAPDNTNYDTLSGYTLNLWVKPRTDSGLTKQGIVVKEGVVETWVHNSGNSLGVRINVGGVWYQALTTSYAKDRWYMLTVRYDGATMRAYLNGSQFYSINTPGAPAENNLPWYFGRYPSLNTYSDIDLCDVQFWNYALDNAEVSAMYKPPARRNCVACYIAENPAIETNSVKRCYLQSPATSENPIAQTVSQMCEFGEQAVAETKAAFIVAGGEAQVSWDTRFVTNYHTTTTWDNIILVTGNQTRINELQLGSVVYPITRNARRQVRIPTSVDPLTQLSHTDCWMVSYHVGQITPRMAYIPTVSYQRDRKSVYLHGFFTNAEDSQACYITNNQMAAPAQFMYMAGIHVFRFNWNNRAYINCYIDNLLGDTSAFVGGRDVLRGSQRGYVHAAPWATARSYAFIMSLADTMEAPEQGVFIKGNVGITRNRNAYINGHFSDRPSTGAFITATNTIFAPVNCFIQSENPMKVSKRVYMRSYAGVTLSKSLYLKAEVSASGTKTAFVSGRAPRISIQRLYIAGPVMTPLTGTKRAYVSNGVPVASMNAFIVSGPLSFRRCYIVNSGTATKRRSAFIAA